MMWRAVLVSSLVAATCGAQSGSPVPATFFGMSAVRGNYPKVTFGTLAHQEFAWARIEQSRGNFNFQVFDNYLAAAQQQGLVDPVTRVANMVMTLAAGTPGWAVADQSTCSGTNIIQCTAPPDTIQDWTDFLTALLQHYNGTTQPHIRYYELWNESNVSLWWTGTDAQMLALAQAAYPIIHQDPYSMLLTPSVAGPVGTASPHSGVTWMTSYLQAGGSQYADGGAFHGYLGAQSGVDPFPMPEDDSTSGCKPFVSCYGSVVTKATQMREVFDQNGLAGKPMFQTEGSWGNNTVTDPDTQVAWLARYNLLQAGLRSTLNLQMAAWFTWADPSFGWGDIATASFQPSAAGLAYNQVYDWVVGATVDQPCSGGANGTWTCTLTRTGGYVAQAVWNTQGATTYTPGAGYTQYRDLAGNTLPLSAGEPVDIGAKPILVEKLAGATGGPCVGDCNQNGEVTVDEILTLTQIALGATPLVACAPGDANRDGHVTVDEILAAVDGALNGCTTPAPVVPAAAGIYVLNEAANEQSTSTAYAPGLTTSPAYENDVAGHAIFVPIAKILPAVSTWGQFNWDWTYLDTLVQIAVSHGKKFSVELEVGFQSGATYLQSLPGGFTASCGADCAPLFDVWVTGGSGGRCTSAYVLLPWVPNVQEFWSAAASALAAHLRQTGVYGSLTLVHVPGLSVYDEEIRLPTGSPSPSSTDTQPCPDGRPAYPTVLNDAATSRWQNLGYSDAAVINSFKAIATAFAQAFPDRVLGLSLFNPGPNGIDFPNLTADPPGFVASQIVQAVSAIAPGRVQLQSDNLDSTFAQAEVTNLAAQYSDLVGWQTNKHAETGAGCNGGGAGSCDPDGPASPYFQLLRNGWQHGGAYVEVWSHDVVSYPQSFAAATSAGFYPVQ